jgi:hypothetical protein
MMKKPRRAALATLVLASLASFGANAAVYDFDSLSTVQMGLDPYIVGIPRNTSTPITLTFASSITDSERCLPLFLTMLEKPGRYYLRITTLVATTERLTHCALSLR